MMVECSVTAAFGRSGIIPDDCAVFAHTAKRPYVLTLTFIFTIERVLYMSKHNFNQEIL